MLGSGNTAVPSVPAISTKPARASFESKLKTACALAPLSNCRSALTCVGTSTGNSVPAFGPEPMARVSRAFEDVAVTLATGPKTWTRVVR